MKWCCHEQWIRLFLVNCLSLCLIRSLRLAGWKMSKPVEFSVSSRLRVTVLDWGGGGGEGGGHFIRQNFKRDTWHSRITSKLGKVAVGSEHFPLQQHSVSLHSVWQCSRWIRTPVGVFLYPWNDPLWNEVPLLQTPATSQHKVDLDLLCTFYFVSN